MRKLTQVGFALAGFLAGAVFVASCRDGGSLTFTGAVGAAVAEAIDILYSNATSGLAATNVQAAIDELDGRVDAAAAPATVTIAVDLMSIPAFESGFAPDHRGPLDSDGIGIAGVDLSKPAQARIVYGIQSPGGGPPTGDDVLEVKFLGLIKGGGFQPLPEIATGTATAPAELSKVHEVVMTVTPAATLPADLVGIVVSYRNLGQDPADTFDGFGPLYLIELTFARKP